MKKNEIIYVLIGLLLGIIITWSVSSYAVNGNHTNMMRMMGMHYSQKEMMDNSTNTIHDTSKCTSTQCGE